MGNGDSPLLLLCCFVSINCSMRKGHGARLACDMHNHHRVIETLGRQKRVKWAIPVSWGLA